MKHLHAWCKMQSLPYMNLRTRGIHLLQIPGILVYTGNLSIARETFNANNYVDELESSKIEVYTCIKNWFYYWNYHTCLLQILLLLNGGLIFYYRSSIPMNNGGHTLRRSILTSVFWTLTFLKVFCNSFIHSTMKHDTHATTHRSPPMHSIVELTYFIMGTIHFVLRI